MLVTGSILAALAAVVHVYIFVLESLLWTAPRTRAVFRLNAMDAETTRLLAFNQGFYNLFLAIVTAIGIALLADGTRGAGAALLFAGTGSMLAAAVVLAARSPNLMRAAVVQGAPSALAIAAIIAGLANGG